MATVLAVVADTGAQAATATSPWSQADYNAAQSRANLTEKTLTPTTVAKVHYLRSITTPPLRDGCLEDTAPMGTLLTGGRVYTVIDGELIAYNAATGAVVWKANVDPTLDNFWSLDVANGFVIAGVNDCESQSDPEGSVMAFNASTGKAVWSYSPGNAVRDVVVSGAFVVETGATDTDAQTTAVLKIATGVVVWDKASSGCEGGGLAVVAGNVIWDRCGGDTGSEGLEADVLATGVKVWSRTDLSQVQRGDTDATTGHHVYATNNAATFGTGPVSDLNPGTGASRFTLPGATNVLAVDATDAYADCGASSVCGYSKATGAKIWTNTSDAPNQAAEADGVLYLDDGDALTTTTAKVITSLWGASAAAETLVVGDGRIAVVNDPRVLDLYGLAGF